MTPHQLACTHFRAMSSGDPALAAQAIHPGHVNHMAPDHPPASALPGLPGFLATSAWLRLAFAELTFEITDLVSEGRQTIAHVTMSGRQHGPFVVFPPGKRPVAFPATGRPFAARQCHIFTIEDGQHRDHTAVRDDLTMLTQLGHLPPGPAVAARMARFAVTGGRGRAVRDAVRVARQAADEATARQDAAAIRRRDGQRLT
jgi:predicted ester cyclase